MQKLIFGLLLITFALYRPKGLIPAKNKIFDEEKLKDGAAQKDSIVTDHKL